MSKKKILLINVDSKKIPNIALKKCEMYHLEQGDEIHWNFHLIKYNVDKIYVSCVFEHNRDECLEYSDMENAMIGGSGWDFKTVNGILQRVNESYLPEKIERMRPKINIGFTSKGCIRKCKFCIVPKLEGKFHVIGDIYDFWDGESKKIAIIDNNILADEEHFIKICKQIYKNKLKVDFNQGLDHRLLNLKMAKALRKISHTEYRFAFDHPSYEKTVVKAIEILNQVKMGRCIWYVLVGFNTTLQEDLDRINLLIKLKQNPYVMVYKMQPYIKSLVTWEQSFASRRMGFKEYMDLPEQAKYKDLVYSMIERWDI